MKELLYNIREIMLKTQNKRIRWWQILPQSGHHQAFAFPPSRGRSLERLPSLWPGPLLIRTRQLSANNYAGCDMLNLIYKCPKIQDAKTMCQKLTFPGYMTQFLVLSCVHFDQIFKVISSGVSDILHQPIKEPASWSAWTQHFCSTRL